MGRLCDVPGIRVGHAQNEQARTGCTVILPDVEAVAGVDVRGSAPGSREIELLKPVRLVQTVHAILLTGGSAFGLEAAGGVMAYLEEQGIGYDTGVAKVPLVPTAVIYDLAVGDAKIRPDSEMGRRACEAAQSDTIEEGLVGVGTGATVGKMAGQENAMLGGVGTCSAEIGDTTIVGVLTVVNSLGNVVDPKTGTIIAGARSPNGSGFVDAAMFLHQHGSGPFSRNTNTTLSVIATNARLTRESAIKVAQMAQDGIARAIRPAHTMFDGDTIFVISVGDQEVDVNVVGAVGADLVEESIVRAVKISNEL